MFSSERRAAEHNDLVENANRMLEAWPVLMSVTRGMIQQARQAGYPQDVATLITLASIGLPVRPLSVDDVQE